MAKTDSATPDFNFDKTLRADANNEPFRFVLNGKVRELKHLNDLDSVDLSAVGRTAAANWQVIKLAADAETYAELRAAKPTVGQLNGFVGKYNEHCGIDAGE